MEKTKITRTQVDITDLVSEDLREIFKTNDVAILLVGNKTDKELSAIRILNKKDSERYVALDGYGDRTRDIIAQDFELERLVCQIIPYFTDVEVCKPVKKYTVGGIL